MPYTKDQMEFSVRTIMMYYQTSFRNIGLYTSVSLATLGAARFHRERSFMLNISLIGVAIAFNLIAIAIGVYMLEDINYLEDNQKEDNSLPLLNKWSLLPKITVVVNTCIILSSIFVFYRNLTKK